MEIKFDEKKDIMSSLDEISLCGSEKIAVDWFNVYLSYSYHDVSGISYLIGYFADIEKRNLLFKYLNIAIKQN